jgi:hypothetical protein
MSARAQACNILQHQHGIHLKNIKLNNQKPKLADKTLIQYFVRCANKRTTIFN